MILPYQHILERCGRENMIIPFHDRQVSYGMTYGVGPAGYDVRIAQSIEIPPKGFELASVFEFMNIPNDILGQVCDKSSWARRGLTVQNTIIEPGWFGYLTLELTNHSDKWITLRQGIPICQIIFMQLIEPTKRPYTGKYQNQENRPVPAIDEGEQNA